MSAVEEQLAELIRKVNTGAESASGFLMAETPEVIRQILLWEMVSSLLWVVWGVILLSLLPKALIKAIYYCEEEESPVCIPFWVFCFFGFIFGVCSISNIFTSIQIWIAPKVYLLEYASKLVSGDN